MKNRIIIFLLILSILFINSSDFINLEHNIAYAASNVENDEDKLYLIDEIFNNKKLIVNGRGEVVYISQFKNEEIRIIDDEYKNKQALIQIKRFGEEKIKKTYTDEDGYEYLDEEYSKRTIYLDIEGKELNHITFDDLSFVYNGYAIFNSGAKVNIYSIESNSFKPNEIGINILEYKNNYLFGKKLIFDNDKVNYNYYLFDENIDVIKEISKDEYEDLNGEIVKNVKYILDSSLRIGTKHDKKYILNENYEKLSIGYDCDDIDIANFPYKNPLNYNFKLNDIIFYRIKDKMITYFTLEKELYSKILDNTIDNLGKDYNKTNYRKYSVDEKFVAGGNNCYALISENNAVVYNLDDVKVATLSSILDERNNLELDSKYRGIYYIDDIYICGKYIMCHYIKPDTGDFFTYINVKDGYNGNIINILEANKLPSKKFVFERHDKNDFQIVADAEKGIGLKTIYNRYIDMRVYENDGKYIIALQKEYTDEDDYKKIYDLYDNDFNLLQANVENIYVYKGLIYFRKYKVNEKLFPLNDGMLYNKFGYIINFDNDILFEYEEDKDSHIEYSINSWLKEPLIFKKHYKLNADSVSNDEIDYYEIFNEKKKKVVNLNNIKHISVGTYLDSKILFLTTDSKTYIYSYHNGKYDFKKKIEEPYELEEMKNILSRNNNSFIMMNKNNNLYTLFDENFNVIGEYYKDIIFKEDYYYYVDSDKIFIKDFKNNLISEINYYILASDEINGEVSYEDY